MWSADGDWVYFAHDKGTGGRDVWRRQWPISTGPGFFPVWSPRADEILFRGGPDILSVKVRVDDGLQVSAPTLVTQVPPVRRVSFALDHDASRLLCFADPAQPTTATESRLQLRVVVNWLHELAERVPIER